MSFEAEKKMGFHFSSYVLKSVVELELFSNLRHFKNYCPHEPYIYQESTIRLWDYDIQHANKIKKKKKQG